ncbi:MAG TPA: S41 family peptidase [Anaerolineaceae bacterium]|nr:S41 family peptidase [Anaerolineaceae bacterium]HOH91824.1 S41 family peptidase [Anaerolineaceae bacterium]
MQNKSNRTILTVILIVLIVVTSYGAGVATASLVKFNPIRIALGYDKLGNTVGVSDPCPACLCPDGDGVTEGLECDPCPAIQFGADAGKCSEYVSSSTPRELQTLFKPFWESWNYLHRYYVDQPLDDVELMRGAIQGMLAATGDKHTSYMDPHTYEQANAEMEGSYTGIGAWVNTSGEYVEIVSPMKGSPAEEAGLKPKDIIIAVNGEDVTGTAGDIVLQSILGPAGEVVVLTIRRGDEIFDVSITRRVIEIPVVDYEMLENDIAYIALYTFNDKAVEQVSNALNELMAQNPKGLIFDLRDNGGGYLYAAIDISAMFIEDGVILYEEYGDGTRDTYRAEGDAIAPNIPMVVLINGGSASASEIVAGALQDHGRAKLIGEVSYGKGSVQSWIDLSDNQGGVRITIARWLTPDGNQIAEIGLTPDIEVPYTEADFEAGIDPQRDAAIEYFNK